MRIPYFIDNQSHRLADVLNGLLAEHRGRSLDSVTAYFTVGGFELLKDGLLGLGNFRLLLGAEPKSGEQLGLRPEADAVVGPIRKELEALPFDERTLRSVEDLIGFLRRETSLVRLHDKGFLHAKCWLFYADRPGQQMLFDRFRPVLAIVGSSNFTAPGLTTNRELNLAHKVLLDPAEVDDRDASTAVSWLSDARPSDRITLANRQLLKSEVGARAIIDLEGWYDRQWNDARDFKEDLIALLDASKFGHKEYTPWQVYMKTLYEYFKDDLGEEAAGPTRSAVELAEFQEDAVKKARKILARYDGVVIADSVGLGKTWIAKKLLEDFAYHMRQKALVVSPASLRDMWERELKEASISATVISQEELGREEFDPASGGDADVVVIDESHNFRNRLAQRYANLERILGANGGRGREGGMKKVILLTATPISNDLFDLHNQLCLITRGDRRYFAACGIGDLYKYFLKIRRESRPAEATAALFNLLEEIVIRRTRPFIRAAYPEATIRGRKIRFPNRKLKTIRYNLEGSYEGIYEEIVSGIEKLRLAPYNLEAYKKAGVAVDTFEEGREQALVGIFKSRYLKRLESSVEAFRISVRRALDFLKQFESLLLDGRLLRSSDFHKMLAVVEPEETEDDVSPVPDAEGLGTDERLRQTLSALETVELADFELRKLHEAVQHDVEIFSRMQQMLDRIGPRQDAKLARIKELLATDLRSRKVLLFTYYRDTARYLYRHLGHPDNPEALAFCKELGGVTVRRMDSGADPRERLRIVQAFAPKANDRLEWAGTDKEIDILISTDVLSEGQNLQDCGHLVNYDLHWNPTRMVQRAGRIDRIGTDFDTLWIHNLFPEEGLERILGLVESLNRKIAAIDRAGFLDASVLGESVHPRNFNTLRRIRTEDGAVIEEEEQFSQLASNEFLQQQLRSLLESGGRDLLDELPDGIHSGLAKEGTRGVFFYFQTNPSVGEKRHYWKYYDLRDRRIVDNRFVIANLIACDRETARIVDPDLWETVFDIQEKVIDDILRSHREHLAAQAAPQTIDPIQQTAATAMQQFLNHPDIERREAIEAIRFLSLPMLSVQVEALRDALATFQRKSDARILMECVKGLKREYGERGLRRKLRADPARELRREDLRLICFDLISGG
jgi:superfamily II DNA or RNA helicase